LLSRTLRILRTQAGVEPGPEEPDSRTDE